MFTDCQSATHVHWLSVCISVQPVYFSNCLFMSFCLFPSISVCHSVKPVGFPNSLTLYCLSIILSSLLDIQYFLSLLIKLKGWKYYVYPSKNRQTVQTFGLLDVRTCRYTVQAVKLFYLDNLYIRKYWLRLRDAKANEYLSKQVHKVGQSDPQNVLIATQKSLQL